MESVFLYVSRFMSIHEIDRLFVKKCNYLDMVKYHINYNYASCLSKEDLKLISSIGDVNQLPISLYLKIWKGDELIFYVERDNLLDVRTKVQLIMHLRWLDGGKFIDIYNWYISSVYNRSNVHSLNGISNVLNIVKCLDFESQDIVLSCHYVFKRTSWGFLVYEGTILKASGYLENSIIDVLGTCNSGLYELLTNKYIFDVQYAIYKGNETSFVL